MEVKQKPIFVKIKYWIDNYGSGGAEDKRGLHDFVDCEATESVNSLRAELIGLSQGAYDETHLNALIGAGRKDKHGSYNAWAKMMLLWLSSYKA